LKKNLTPKYVQLFGYCGRLLGVNYRVGLCELSALGMLDTNNGRDLVFYSLGLRDFLDQQTAQKKLDHVAVCPAPLETGRDEPATGDVGGRVVDN
jgi:hypothetical protein